MGYFYSDEYLEHHGILGQKWGVRRFENKDGTLTPAGRSRYDTDSNGDYKKLSSKSKTTGAYEKYKRSINLADKAERKYSSNTNNDKAREEWGKHLKDAKNAKKDFTRADKKQLKEDERNRKSKTVKVDVLPDGTVRKTEVTKPTMKERLSDPRVKKAAIIGAAAVGTALVAYGGYKLAKNGAVKKAEKAKELRKAAEEQGLHFNDLKTVELKKVTPKTVPVKTTEVKKAATNLADKKATDTVKKTVKAASESVKSSSPAKFEFEKFEPTKFDFEKFEYQNNELVQDLLKKNAKKLGL